MTAVLCHPPVWRSVSAFGFCFSQVRCALRLPGLLCEPPGSPPNLCLLNTGRDLVRHLQRGELKAQITSSQTSTCHHVRDNREMFLAACPIEVAFFFFNLTKVVYLP